MALSTEETKLAQTLKKSGKTNSEVFRIIANRRANPEPVAPEPTLAKRAGSVATGVAKGLAESTIGTASLLQKAGQGAISTIVGAIDPNKTIGETYREIQQSTGFQSLQGEQKQQIDELLRSQNQDESTGKVIAVIGEILAGGAPAIRRGAIAGAEAISSVGEAARGAITSATKGVSEVGASSGIKQTISEFAERIPRFFGRVREGAEEAAARAEKIRTSSPEVANAIKLDLPEKYINTVTQADAPTKQAYKRVLDLAEETPKTVGVKTNPTIVGGELAGKQYDLIEKQRQTIGKQIGEVVERLGKSKVTANMRPAFQQVDDVLTENGIKISENGKLSSLRYTDKEMSVIQDLYDKSRKGGDVLTAIDVRDIDNLFSKLQREARVEGIGNIFVKVNGKDMNLFRLFRDVYSNELEQIAPEIRELNKQYRNIVTLIDDIEDSIIKTPNFNVTRSTDPAEFAKVNLRRIFGEAQSSPAYEAIADEMDTVARQLGYADAKPKDVAAFAQEIRELFPSSVPRTGFSGGIRASISDIIEKVSEVGAPNAKDKVKALRALLDVQ